MAELDIYLDGYYEETCVRRGVPGYRPGLYGFTRNMPPAVHESVTQTTRRVKARSLNPMRTIP